MIDFESELSEFLLPRQQQLLPFQQQDRRREFEYEEEPQGNQEEVEEEEAERDFIPQREKVNQSIPTFYNNELIPRSARKQGIYEVGNDIKKCKYKERLSDKHGRNPLHSGARHRCRIELGNHVSDLTEYTIHPSNGEPICNYIFSTSLKTYSFQNRWNISGFRVGIDEEKNRNATICSYRCKVSYDSKPIHLGHFVPRSYGIFWETLMQFYKLGSNLFTEEIDSEGKRQMSKQYWPAYECLTDVLISREGSTAQFIFLRPLRFLDNNVEFWDALAAIALEFIRNRAVSTPRMNFTRSKLPRITTCDPAFCQLIRHGIDESISRLVNEAHYFFFRGRYPKGHALFCVTPIEKTIAWQQWFESEITYRYSHLEEVISNVDPINYAALDFSDTRLSNRQSRELKKSLQTWHIGLLNLSIPENEASLYSLPWYASISDNLPTDYENNVASNLEYYVKRRKCTQDHRAYMLTYWYKRSMQIHFQNIEKKRQKRQKRRKRRRSNTGRIDEE